MVEFYITSNGCAYLGPLPLAPRFAGVTHHGQATATAAPVHLATAGSVQAGDVIHVHERGNYSVTSIQPLQ